MVLENTNDYSKKILWLPKLLLSLVYLWPEITNINRKRMIVVSFMFGMLFISYGVTSYIAANIYNIQKSFAAFSNLSNIFQGMSKTVLIYYYSDRLQTVLKEVCNDFWSSTVDEASHKHLKKRYQIMIDGMFIFVGSTAFFLVEFVVLPLVNNTDKNLPYLSIYPFDWELTPIWQILFVFHCIVDLYVIPVTVFGFDFLFVGLCFTVMAQYIILRDILLNLGTENMEKFLYIIDKYENFGEESKDNITRMFLKMCGKHHVRLLKVIQEIESIFNIACFLQLINSVVAMCVASFVTTTASVNSSQVAVMLAYLSGYFTQLAVYCFIGNELYHESVQLPDYIFGSNWYETDNIDIKKDIVLFLNGAQLPAKVSAFKYFVLNFPTFIAVLRMSFSFYTLLSTVTEN